MAKKCDFQEFPQTTDYFPEERKLDLSGSPPYQIFPTEIDNPTVNTPIKNTAESTIQSDQETKDPSSASWKTVPSTNTTPHKTGGEVPITSTPQRLPDSPFPTRTSPNLYKQLGTPYRKVDPPHSDPKFVAQI